MKNNFIWNVVGSTAVAAFTVIITLIITRISGLDEAGVFSIGIAIANLLYTVATFGIRNYQASDVKGEYKFNDYLYTRIFTCILAIIIAIFIIYNNQYRYDVLLVILILCLYKVVDAISDVYQGMFQLNDRLDIAGKSNFIRIVASIVIFNVIIIYTQNLFTACLGMLFINIILVYLYDIKKAKPFLTSQGKTSIDTILKMLRGTITLFGTLFLMTYIVNSSKYAIDQFMASEDQAIYNILFLPSLVINLAMEFLLRPILVSLAHKWENNKIKEFLSEICKVIVIAVICGGVGVVASYYIGIPILQILYNISLEQHTWILVILMTSAGITAIGRVFTYALITMRKQKILLICYMIGSLGACVLTTILVKIHGMIGAAIGNLCIAIILTVSLGTAVMGKSWEKHQNNLSIKEL